MGQNVTNKGCDTSKIMPEALHTAAQYGKVVFRDKGLFVFRTTPVHSRTYFSHNPN